MRLRLATLNVWALPPPVGRHVHQRMHAIGAALPSIEAHVIAFQEVWLESARITLTQAGQRAGFHHIWQPPRARSGGGLLVLSRLPITASRFVRFRHRGFPERLTHMDYYGGKGFALLLLESKAGPVALATTHLHASYVGEGAHDEYESVRTAQIIDLASGLHPIEEPLFVLGDFNLVDESRNHRVLSGLTGLIDSAAFLDRREPTLLIDNPYHRADHVPGRRIDYIFFRSGAQRSLHPRSLELAFHQPLHLAGEAAAYSDHAGLLAEVEIGADPAAPGMPDEMVARLARDLLQEGRDAAYARRSRQRKLAAGGLTGSLVALGLTDRMRKSRRSLLTGVLGALAGTSFLAGAGLALLSELFAPEEIAAYRTAEQQLNALLNLHDTTSATPPE